MDCCFRGLPKSSATLHWVLTNDCYFLLHQCGCNAFSIQLILNFRAAVLAATHRQKKERVFDSDELEEMEGINNEYHNQFHHRMDKSLPQHKDKIHYLKGRKKKERVMDSTHLMDVEGSNKLHRVHAQNKEKQTVPLHKIVLKTNNPEILADHQLQQVLNSSTYPPVHDESPDIGILSPDYAVNATVACNLQTKKKRRQRRPRSCWKEIPALQRAAQDAKFTKAYCDDTNNGAMAYWNIKD